MRVQWRFAPVLLALGAALAGCNQSKYGPDQIGFTDTAPNQVVLRVDGLV
jgi:hypothetical protein